MPDSVRVGETGPAEHAGEQEHGGRPGRHGSRLIERIRHTPRARRLEVVRTIELSATMRRIVLSGADLEPDFPILPLAATDHVKACFPDETTGVLALPEPGASLRGPAGSAPLTIRDYTVRAFDPQTRELSLDFVLHDHGPAGRWAITARPGSALGVLGPRGSQVYPGRFGRYLLIADETAFPAAERFLAELPGAALVSLMALASSEASRRELGASRARESWLIGDAAAETVTGALDALLGQTDETFVWGAGEAGLMQKLRRHLRTEHGMDLERVDVRGYWRHGLPGATAHDLDEA